MEEAQLVRIDRITATGIVAEGPCFIYSICGIGLAETSNVYTVYDGQNTEGKIKFRLVAGAYSADFRLYACPLYFAKGLYIAFTTNGEEVAIQLLELLHEKPR